MRGASIPWACQQASDERRRGRRDFAHTPFQGSTSGFYGAAVLPCKIEHDLNSVALWRGRAVQPTPETRRAVFERSEFACRRGRRTAQGTRRAPPRPQWFWVLLPKQKGLGCWADPRHHHCSAPLFRRPSKQQTSHPSSFPHAVRIGMPFRAMGEVREGRNLVAVNPVWGRRASTGAQRVWHALSS